MCSAEAVEENEAYVLAEYRFFFNFFFVSFTVALFKIIKQMDTNVLTVLYDVYFSKLHVCYCCYLLTYLLACLLPSFLTSSMQQRPS
jgi:putative effector of murein hydrolase LrgA (UPF0299 family)